MSLNGFNWFSKNSLQREYWDKKNPHLPFLRNKNNSYGMLRDPPLSKGEENNLLRHNCYFDLLRCQLAIE
jgi:hypothetical protein